VLGLSPNGLSNRARPGKKRMIKFEAGPVCVKNDEGKTAKVVESRHNGRFASEKGSLQGPPARNPKEKIGERTET